VIREIHKSYKPELCLRIRNSLFLALISGSLVRKMVLDPFTAIGLAGNIVQFIDYSSKLITSAYEIYKSSTGSAPDHVHLDGIATRLLELTRSLQEPESHPSSSHERSPALQKLVEECCQDSQALLDLIKALRAKNGSKWSRFRQAIKSTLKKEQIDRLENRLRDHRNEIAFHLVAMLRYVILRFLAILPRSLRRFV
jgi:N-terminal domain on NACHT_NTPase and P-loop NTPases